MLHLVVHPLAASFLPPLIPIRHLFAPLGITHLDPASPQSVSMHQDSFPFGPAALHDELPTMITPFALVLEARQSRLQGFEDL